MFGLFRRTPPATAEPIEVEPIDPMNSLYDEICEATKSGAMIWCRDHERAYRGYWSDREMRVRVSSTFMDSLCFNWYRIYRSESELSPEVLIGSSMNVDMPEKDCPKNRMLKAIVENA